MGTTSYFDSPGKESFKIGNWQPGEGEEFKEGELRLTKGQLDENLDDVAEDENDDDDENMREFKALQKKQANNLQGKFT